MWKTYPGHVSCTVAIAIVCLFVMVVMLFKSTVSTPKLCHKPTESPCRIVKKITSKSLAVEDVDIHIVAHDDLCEFLM